ncbi:hypothetical protein VNO80_16044 [Phaseolus coccineus]|uniref:EF-hand domain-containing protein n=1 Tax=Phaseolus coccineus TaxID=3886 RepID=A0AAN9MSI6_PHACN
MHGLVDLEQLFDGNGLFEVGFNVSLQGGPLRLGNGIVRDVSSDVVEEYEEKLRYFGELFHCVVVWWKSMKRVRREAINEFCCEDGLAVLLNSVMASATPNVDLFNAYFRCTDLDRDGRISDAEIVSRHTPPWLMLKICKQHSASPKQDLCIYYIVPV